MSNGTYTKPHTTKYVERQDGLILVIGGPFDGRAARRCYCSKKMFRRNVPVGLIIIQRKLMLCHLDCLSRLRVRDGET